MKIDFLNKYYSLCQSRKHLTGNAFALDDGYSETEKLIGFIPCDSALWFPQDEDVRKSTAKSAKLQLEFR
jgi:hypothetical protein